MSGDHQKVFDFQDVILSFYKQHGRTLPWRRTTDPYKVGVSELMLQQTQVSRVVDKYEEFLAAFPTAQVLAEASFADVLALWQGLGYNRRAHYAQNLAQLLVENPSPGYDELLCVKGVGSYTAAAICVFAYNEDRAAVDVNVRRVHQRFFGAGVSDAFIASCVPQSRSRDWHNALMDFGSLVCTKKNPSCNECPLRKQCFAYTNDSFAREPMSTQPRFLGSVRWHRGQILKALLVSSLTQEALWACLEESIREKEKFSLAIAQLQRERFIVFDDPLFVIEN